MAQLCSSGIRPNSFPLPSGICCLIFPYLPWAGFSSAAVFSGVITSYSIHYTKLYELDGMEMLDPSEGFPGEVQHA